MYTLPVALATFATGQYQADHGMLMAGSVDARRARADRLHPLPALDHRRHRHDRPQGLSRGGPRSPSRPHRRTRHDHRAASPASSVLAARRPWLAARARPPPAAGVDAAGVEAPAERATLLGYARDTWASFVAMTDPTTGLPADSLSSDGTTERPDVDDEHRRLHVERGRRRAARDHRPRRGRRRGSTRRSTRSRRWSATSPSGQYYNWYDHHTGAKLTAWPPTGAPLTPILSSVDNGWLATGLHVVANSASRRSRRAPQALFDSMDFGFYYRPAVNRIAFHVAPDTGDSPCCYDTIVSESRIATYIGIAKGELPDEGVLRRVADVPRHL